MDLRVSTKGAVSIYELQFYPFRLYAGEWAKVFAATPVICEAIARHHERLSCGCTAGNRETLERLLRSSHSVESRVWIRCGVSKHGKVNLYGLRRFPVALSCDGWIQALASRAEIEAFIDANKEFLSTGAGRLRMKADSTSSPYRPGGESWL